ncbi:IclR family transcriptional regulator [Desmospora sp. 8437]|nr:IclR family transcriptional regulator [Desmospora sp. 8437]
MRFIIIITKGNIGSNIGTRVCEMSLKTLDNSLELLKYFTEKNTAWGVRELAKEMNMSHSIVYRILSTFEKHGFLIQNPDTKKYELGLKFWEYGQLVQEKFRLLDLIHPIMERISEETGESIFLTRLDGMEGVCADIAESSQMIKYAVSVGTRTPLYAGASNKTIMAYLPKEKQEAIIQEGLNPMTDKTIVDADKLISELAEIREKGWCFSVGEYSESVFALTVPLFNWKKEIIASLAMAGPEYRVNDMDVPEMLKILQRECSEIQNYFDRYRITHI